MVRSRAAMAGDVARQRLLDAARRLSHRPDAAAGRPPKGRSRVVGVISFDTNLIGPASTLLGVERAARAAGLALSVATPQRIDQAGVRSALRMLAGQSVTGVVVIAPQPAAAAAVQSLPAGLAAVVAMEAGTGWSVPAISVDQAAGARMAVEHLLRLGHRRVWHVAGPPGWPGVQGRAQGWREALRDAGLVAPALLTGDWSARSGYEAGLTLAARGGATAVFAGNDQMAMGMMRAFHEHGMRLPGDVSIVGFDDIPEAEFLFPPLTTIRQDFDEIGRRCIAALLRLVAADPRQHPAPDPRVVPTLIARSSTAPPPTLA
jgi:DNA-binding LacI/PurR family transcriptional regulator